MKDRKGFTLIELLVVIAIIAVLAAILFPVFAKARKTAQTANCESNMKQIGNAIKMYMADNDDAFPTQASPDVALTDQNDSTNFDADGKLIIFRGGGVNWVEALFKYIDQAGKQADPMSVWRCQSAASSPIPTGSTTAAVTYAFNMNLVAQPEGVIKGAQNLMMCRELDSLENAELRPNNVSTGSPDTPPTFPFLNGQDLNQLGTPGANSKLHGAGTHILFADGHVRLFNAQYFPVSGTGNCEYDSSNTQQWWNAVTGANGVSAAARMQIAVTP